MLKQFAIAPLIALSMSAANAFEPMHNMHGNQHVNHVTDMQQGAHKTFDFNFPNINLINQYNETVALNDVFSKQDDTVFAFFFTHCVSVCSTITMSLKSISENLPKTTQLVMISIDPTTDTPDRLKSYAEEYQIQEANWQLLTGDEKQIVDLQKQFEAYRGNKMNHSTSLFVWKAESGSVMEFETNFAHIPNMIAQN